MLAARSLVEKFCAKATEALSMVRPAASTLAKLCIDADPRKGRGGYIARFIERVTTESKAMPVHHADERSFACRFVCRFSDACMTTPSTRAAGRRPKGAKA